MTPPSSIAHYRITAKLGEGGMGAVYRATDTKLGRDVALKVLPDAFAQDVQRMGRFAREAQILASLNHPNIAAIYGVEDRALVMELVGGTTLADRIAAGPVLMQEALPIARQIAEALEYAHERGVIHRDLKPANIKVNPEGRVKVLDFGLAKALGGDAPSGDPAASPTLTMQATAAGVILGTAAYMSPEQARGKSADKRADIWSFGVVLLEMLTGQLAYRGETLSDTLASVIKDDPRLDRLPGNTPAPIRRLLKRCLDKDPHRRLRDIGEARIALEDALAGAPAEERAAPVAAVRRPVYLVAAAAALAVAVLVFAAEWWRATRPVERPLMRFNADLGPEAVAGFNCTVAISPDGEQIVYLVRGAGGLSQLATRQLQQAAPTLLEGTDGAGDPFFSPNGQWIGFTAGGKLKKISVHGGASVTLCDIGPGGLRGATWGEDGYIVVTLNSGAGVGLSRVADAGGAPPQLVSNPGETGEASHRWPQILPGGEFVLFTGNRTPANWDDASIEVLSLKTLKLKVVQRGGYYGRYLPAGYLVYVHQGTLFGVPFDLARLEVRGTPAPLLEDVAANVTTGGGQFDFSRTGAFLYLSGKAQSSGWTIAWMDSAGKLNPLPASRNTYVNPRLSPDGKKLAMAVAQSRGAGIAVYDWQRDTLTQLTAGAGDRFPVWTPDGKYLAFQSVSSGYSIQWIRADGGGEAQRLVDGKSAPIPYSFSPDGKRLAYSDTTTGQGYAIWTLPLDLADPEHPKPGKPEPFLHAGSNGSQPAFSPDGRWIAYASNDTGPMEVYVRPFPGPGGKWLVSSGGGAYPVWSRNGRELFFEGLDNRIMMAEYAVKGDTFDVLKPRLWSPTAIYPTGAQQHADLAPDGKRFVVFPLPEAPGDQKGSVHVAVALNFFDEVRRRLRGGL